MVKLFPAVFARIALLSQCAVVFGIAAKSACGQVGDVQNVHDPVIIKAGDSFYVFWNGPGIPVRQSTDLFTWHSLGPAFKEPPKWAADEFRVASPVGTGHFIFQWHVSLVLRRIAVWPNRSAIGLATSKSLDPQSPDYGWNDQGMVIETHQGDNWNAIDPNLVLDENGDPWLAAGSFWTGIGMRRLGRETGKASESDPKLYSLASRQQSPCAIEAAFIIRHGGFYYLFVSFDTCCRGVNSTYKTLVGRRNRSPGRMRIANNDRCWKEAPPWFCRTKAECVDPGTAPFFRSIARTGSYTIFTTAKTAAGKRCKFGPSCGTTTAGRWPASQFQRRWAPKPSKRKRI